MKKTVCILNKDLSVKEFNGERVITFEDVDLLHERPSGTARKRFNDNKDKFLHGQDYYELKKKALSDFRTDHPGTLSKYTPEIILINESGYLMLVKSLTDDLAWEVQRQLVNNYFRAKKVMNPQNEYDIMRMMVDKLEEVEGKIDTFKDTLIQTKGDWRNWVNDQFGKIGFINGNYRELRKQSYDILENRARCRLSVRLDNLRDRLAEKGASKTKISQANYLDVIEDDPRLKEIYTSVVEKIAIKYSA